MKNLYLLATLLATSAHAEFNNLWVSQYDNLIVELGDNKYESSIIRSYEDTINLVLILLLVLSGIPTNLLSLYLMSIAIQTHWL